MAHLIINKRNRKRNRLTNYDYSQDGCYFITICVKNREEFFGEIKNDTMILNECGKIVQNQWFWLKKQYNYVILDEYVVMPNHIHVILIIENGLRRDNPRIVPTWIVPTNTTTYQRRHNLLSKTINAFKTTSSKIIHQNGWENFIWQRSFYDHIIRDEKSLNNIREYIRNNPFKWAMNRNNQENLYY